MSDDLVIVSLSDLRRMFEDTVPLNQRLLLSMNDVARLCGVGVSTAHRWAREGLPLVPHMDEKRVSRKCLDEWLAANPHRGAVAA